MTTTHVQNFRRKGGIVGGKTRLHVSLPVEKSLSRVPNQLFHWTPWLFQSFLSVFFFKHKNLQESWKIIFPPWLFQTFIQHSSWLFSEFGQIPIFLDFSLTAEGELQIQIFKFSRNGRNPVVVTSFFSNSFFFSLLFQSFQRKPTESNVEVYLLVSFPRGQLMNLKEKSVKFHPKMLKSIRFFSFEEFSTTVEVIWSSIHLKTISMLTIFPWKYFLVHCSRRGTRT